VIIVKLQGGMGNQLFQYALARRLASERATEVGLDLTFLLDRTPRRDFVFRDYDLDLFRVRAKVLGAQQVHNLVHAPRSRLLNRSPIIPALNLWRRGGNSGVYLLARERFFSFDRRILESPSNTFLDGYWQSPRYFAPITAELKADLALRDPPPARIRGMAERIASLNSVCLNVRRTDYVANKAAASFHGVCDPAYYERALAALVPCIGAPEIFVTSDDVPWCRENLHLPYPTHFLDHDWAGPRFSHYLELMRACRHFVIPNSTFSCWAAWLGEFPGKVVVGPVRWFSDPSIETRDLFPPGWIRV